MVARPVVLSLMLAAVAGCGNGGPTAPSLPQPTGFGIARPFSTHVAIDATFQGGGRTVPGLLLLPPGAQPHPVLVLVRGSKRWTRVDYEPFTANFVSRGYGVFSYDKAAAGDFDRFADDAAAAARLIGGHPRVT